ncbi:MAG: hypothetical protein KDD01_04280 [Phaeodactylibacter sp.]|nr:hypothetical protein [Phaeodactylibacter sp.]
MANDKVFRLLGLFFLALLLFNFPILNLFSQGGSLGSIPVLFVYIFLGWGLLILFTARLVESKPEQNNKTR